MTGKPFILAGLILATAVSAISAPAAPRQYKSARHVPAGPSAAEDVQKANAAARVGPSASTFSNAQQVYAFIPGALYQVYTSVGKVTDIALQPGERLVGTGPVAAGDTARWIIGTTESGTGDQRQVHILVKPTLPNLATNLVINSDRRTYHIELQALPATYMASVSWRYPQDELVAVALAADKAQAQAPVAQGIDLARLNFNYRLEGDRVSWRPLRAFDDGAKLYIEMPPATAGAELPPLFSVGDDGKAELVNYRVQTHFLIVDRLLDRAEMRLGDKGGQKVVRIRRVGGQRP
jgi:type IV secretion system protein TrbG